MPKTTLEYDEDDLKKLIAEAVGAKPKDVTFHASENRDAHDRPMGGYTVRCEIVKEAK